MNYRLIGDSCSDLLEYQKDFVKIVPLTLEIGEYSILDDENFRQQDFIDKMAASSIGAKTACPSPENFKKAYEESEEENIFVVTLSEHLSGTYQSAVIGKQMYEEEYGNAKNILVISSNSASAGQTRMLMELERLCKLDLGFEEISKRILEFKEKIKTYFVLESLDTLKKNGRLSGLSAFIATALNIKPVMGAQSGKIIKLDQARGINKALSKMVEIAIKEAGDKIGEKIVVIAECNNRARGELIADMFRECKKFKDVIITTTAGVATIYAGDGGIVLGIA